MNICIVCLKNIEGYLYCKMCIKSCWKKRFRALQKYHLIGNKLSGSLVRRKKFHSKILSKFNKSVFEENENFKKRINNGWGWEK